MKKKTQEKNKYLVIIVAVVAVFLILYINNGIRTVGKPTETGDEESLEGIANDIEDTLNDPTDSFDTPPVDAVVILGKSMADDDGIEEMNERLEEALRLIEEGIIDDTAPIIVAGGNPDDTEMTEAEYMQDWLIEHGVDEDRIIMEDESENTIENFENIDGIMDALDIEDYVVVTTDIHADFTTGPCPFFSGPASDCLEESGEVIVIEYEEPPDTDYEWIEAPWYRFDFDDNLEIIIVHNEERDVNEAEEEEIREEYPTIDQYEEYRNEQEYEEQGWGGDYDPSEDDDAHESEQESEGQGESPIDGSEAPTATDGGEATGEGECREEDTGHCPGT